MSRARAARVGVFAGSSPRLQDLRAVVGRYMPEAELLRRLVPILLAIFAFVAIVGFAFQLAHGKRDALDAARRLLTLNADVAALNLKDKTLSSSRDWQTALAASLPKAATRDGRMALFADAEGNIQARCAAGRRARRQPAHRAWATAAAHHLRRRSRRAAPDPARRDRCDRHGPQPPAYRRAARDDPAGGLGHRRLEERRDARDHAARLHGLGACADRRRSMVPRARCRARGGRCARR